MFRNPLVGRFSRAFLAEGREIFGRDAEFVGIPLNGVVLHVDSMQQVEETLEMIIGSLHVEAYAIGQHSVFQSAT